LHWLDATCSGRVDVLDSDGKRVLSFSVRGEGTSPRSTALTDDDRDVAYEQAAHQAAFMAAEAITPRLVRESIELDDSAPAFDDGYAMVRSDRLEDARSIWLAALARHAASASLHYNLAAVCEAIGDVATARTYLEKAVRLSAGDRRFVTELNRFQQRNATTAPK
jgi:Flp pilus assembly protein TadD